MSFTVILSIAPVSTSLLKIMIKSTSITSLFYSFVISIRTFCPYTLYNCLEHPYVTNTPKKINSPFAGLFSFPYFIRFKLYHVPFCISPHADDQYSFYSIPVEPIINCYYTIIRSLNTMIFMRHPSIPGALIVLYANPPEQISQ